MRLDKMTLDRCLIALQQNETCSFLDCPLCSNENVNKRYMEYASKLFTFTTLQVKVFF